MSEFLTAATSFPAVIWTVLVLISLGFWLIGGFFGLEGDSLDLDGFDGLDGADVDGVDIDAGDAVADAATSFDLIGALGLNQAPITIVITLVSLIGWLVTMLTVLSVGPDQAGPIGVLVLVASFVVAVVAAGRLARPLGKLYAPNRGIGHRNLIGRICTVRTGRVDDRFGQALVTDDEGTNHLIQVRYPRSNDLAKGSRALIVDVDDGVFRVDPDLTGIE